MTAMPIRRHHLDPRHVQILKDMQMAVSPLSQLTKAIAEAIGMELTQDTPVLIVKPETSEAEMDIAQITVRVKSLERIVEKAQEKYHGNIDKVNDKVASRIHFTHPSQILAFRSLIGTKNAPTEFRLLWEDKGVEFLEQTDHYEDPKPHGFIGADQKVCITLKNGNKVPCEIQFLHHEMRETQRVTYKIYKQLRAIKARVKGRKMTTQETFDKKRLTKILRDLYLRDLFVLGLHTLLKPEYLNPTREFIERLIKKDPEYKSFIEDLQQARLEFAPPKQSYSRPRAPITSPHKNKKTARISP